MYYSTTYNSPLGVITLGSDGTNLVGLWNEGQKYHGASIPDAMAEKDGLPIFDSTKKWLDNYFASKKPSISELLLSPIGTEFRQKVWQVLREIPYGEVITYGDIAQKIAKDKGNAASLSRAVGGAVGHNPISIIIPCHRVIGANGKLTGYAGGLDKKQFLLKLEDAHVKFV